MEITIVIHMLVTFQEVHCILLVLVTSAEMEITIGINMLVTFQEVHCIFICNKC